MRKPSVKHVMHARDLNITYTILAYRQLTRSELIANREWAIENRQHQPALLFDAV